MPPGIVPLFQRGFGAETPFEKGGRCHKASGGFTGNEGNLNSILIFKNMNHKKTYQFGLLAEKITILFLRLKGYQILAWRYKTYLGEIDIIAKKSKMIIFIEVKARRSKADLEEVLRPQQIRRIYDAADLFIAKKPHFHNHNLRFDFVEVGRFFTIKHHHNFIS